MKIISTLFRIFVDKDVFEKTIRFYEDIYQEKCKLRFSYNEIGLELAQVSCYLIISGDPERRRPYELTKITILVESLLDAQKTIIQKGGVILEGSRKVPSGLNMRVQHPEGLIVEYVEHVKGD